MLVALASGCEARPVLEGLEPGAPELDAGPEGTGPRAPAAGWLGDQPPLVRVPCPDAATVEEALDASERQFEAGELAVAFACAELAADLAPQAVEAQHLRAAALAALGRNDDARIAFAMALVLDPDDPETLAAASDFFINVIRPRTRDQLLLGLEYARRGSARAATRRRADRQLRARLLLLEAEAMNDLGSADLALPRIDDVLELVPGWLEAEHERGVSLFQLSRLEEARSAFHRVLERAPDDPYAHYHLALIADHLGDGDAARRHMEAACRGAGDELIAPLELSPTAFEAEVEEAIAELAPEDRELLAAVELELTDLPAFEDLRAVDPPFAPTIMGLYRGLPVGVEEPEAREPGPGRRVHTLIDKGGVVPPRAVVLYRKNLLRVARSRAELDAQIRRTLRHELGHARGLDEDELRRRGLD